MTIRMAFTGAGYIAKIHARAAQAAGVTLAAAVNHRPDSLRAFAAEFSILRQFASVEALLEDGGIDALVVSTPNALHAPQTIAALDAGVHVLVEKPMALDAAEAARMVAAAERSGALLMVAHCWRFDEEVRWLRDRVDRLGPIVRSKGYGVHANWGPSGWFTQKALAGGGALADMGIHAIDTARFLLGDPAPESVYARIGTHYGDYDVDDTGVILVNWAGGATSVIESGWWQPHTDGPEAATQLYGERGLGSVFPTLLRLADRSAGVVEVVESGYPHPRHPHGPQAMYDAQMAYFVDCIRGGQPPTPGGAEGLVNMQIVDAAYESARTGAVVKIFHH
jgi:predicted dehydrogenase